MTENKRFMLDDAGELIDLNTHSFIEYGDEVCNLLNELAEENIELKCKSKMNYERTAYKQLCEKLSEKNKALQERNDRQAKRLDNLYTLIEKQDWKTLKGLIEEFQECEEQLQREWKCYE